MNGFRKKYQIVLMICCFAGINHLYSQFKKENQQFKFFVQVDGLSSLHTRQSVMDHYGFLWIATQDGLNRYDGKRFTIYNKYNNNPFQRLLNSDITSVSFDEVTQMIWVASSLGGINAIDPKTGRVSKALSFVKELKSLPNDWIVSLYAYNDILWIGTNNGLVLFNEKTNKILSTLNQGSIKSIKANSNTIWVHMADGTLEQYDKKTQQLLLRVGSENNARANLKISGVISFTVSEKEVFLFTEKESFKLTAGENGKTNKMVKHPFKGEASIFNKLPISNAIQDIDGQIIAVFKNRLVKIQPESGECKDITPEKLGNQKWEESINSFYIDRNNYLWINYYDGLIFSSNNTNRFQYLTGFLKDKPLVSHAFCIGVLNNKNILIGALDGAYLINEHKRSKLLNNQYITSITALKNFFLCASEKDIYLVTTNGKASSLTKQYKELQPLSEENIGYMLPLGDSVVLFAANVNKSVWAWNYKKKSLRYIEPKDKNSDKTFQINQLFKGSNGKIWVVCISGLYLLDSQTYDFQKVDTKEISQLTDQTIYYNITETSHGFWVATYGDGILFFDHNMQFKKRFNSSNGLSNNAVYKLLPYKDSIIFATTNYGLNEIEIKTGIIRSHFKNDGLHTDNYESECGAALGDSIFVGGLDGFSIVNMKTKLQSVYKPALFITDIIIEQKNHDKTFFDLEIQKLTIPANAIQSVVHFMALEYKNPERIRYEYKMDEKYDKWISLGTQPFIRFINFNPGTYTIQVRARDGFNYTSEQKQLILEFTPKWFQTIWFKVGILFLLMVIFYLLYLYRINQIIQLQHVRQKISSDLHDDVGSTLAGVGLFTQMAMLKNSDNEYLPLIRDGVLAATNSVRDFVWMLNKETDNMRNVLARIKQHIEPIITAADKKLSIDIDEQAGNIELSGEEKRNLFLISKEAMTNSIRHAGCTAIHIYASCNNAVLTIILKDNGKGFEIHPTGLLEHKSGGNGLKNMLQRCKEMGWKVQIESSIETGTAIVMHKKIKS